MNPCIPRLAVLALLTASAIFGGCAASHGPSDEALTRDRLAMLENWMTGSFSSAKQAQADTEFPDLVLRGCRVWRERTDGPWVYVELAEAGAPAKPTVQRVYRLTATGQQTFVASVYEIPDAARFVGVCGTSGSLAGLTPEALTLRDGCATHLTFHPCSEVFTGETVGRGCGSTMSRVEFMTSEVSVTQHGIVSWERGFDAAGRQVAGSTKGGSRFVRDGVAAH